MSCDSGVSSAADTTSKGRCLELFKKRHVMDNLQEVTVGAVGRPGPRQPGSLCHEGTPMETARFPLRYPWLNLRCESRLANALRYATKAQATKRRTKPAQWKGNPQGGEDACKPAPSASGPRKELNRSTKET